MIRPNHGEAFFSLSNLKTYNFDDNEILPSLSNCKFVLSDNIDVAK